LIAIPSNLSFTSHRRAAVASTVDMVQERDGKAGRAASRE
jgi:hypothetical protein